MIIFIVITITITIIIIIIIIIIITMLVSPASPELNKVTQKEGAGTGASSRL